MEVMGAKTADQYKSLVAQRVLSVQLIKLEHDQRQKLFQTRGVVKDRAIWIIIDGGSCHNDMGWPDLLVSNAMVMMAANDCRG
jgi:hypothetical protein